MPCFCVESLGVFLRRFEGQKRSLKFLFTAFGEVLFRVEHVSTFTRTIR